MYSSTHHWKAARGSLEPVRRKVFIAVSVVILRAAGTGQKETEARTAECRKYTEIII